MINRFRNPDYEPSPVRGTAEPDVVEISLLLPGWQACALETVAHDQGLTAAEMVRCLLREFITRLPEDILVHQE